MKHFIFALAVLTNMAVAINQQAYAQGGGNSMGHGGGNGGSDQEMQLTKRAQQIGHFLRSKMGSQAFKMLNPETVLDVINSADIDIVDSEVIDRYGTVRTCVNEPAKALITCNLKKILELGKQDDILTAIIFHEILGLMEIELGHQENVSMYPLSSKILPYHSVIKSTPISEAQIRPEFFGLDNRSYGVTLVNKKTKESLRLICLNDNVEIHRCRNYSLVRQAQKMQTPAVKNVVSISPNQIQAMKLKDVTTKDVKETIIKLNQLKEDGFKYVTLGGTYYRQRRYWHEEYYRYGSGMTQWAAFGAAEILVPFTAPVDTVIEGGKQAINIVSYPIKALVNGIRVATLKKSISNYNKKVQLARTILNQDDDLSLVGTKQSVSDKDYKTVLSILTHSLLTQNIN